MAEESTKAVSEGGGQAMSPEERATILQALDLLIAAPGPYSRAWIAQQLSKGSIALPLSSSKVDSSDTA